MSASIVGMQNPSVVLYGPKFMKIEDKEIPEPGPRDVLIRIAYVGVCGSDVGPLVTKPLDANTNVICQVHFWRHGGINKKIHPERGLVMGHEASGTIHSVGSAVTSVKPGDRVAVEPGTPCRHCKPCKSGLYNLCRDMRFAAAPGPPVDTPGTLSRYFLASEDFVYKISDHMGLQEAILVEPLSVAVHAAKLVDVRPGETVVVMGSGTVGLMCAATARMFGAHRVVLVDILAQKLEFASKWLRDVEVYKSDPGLGAEENSQKLLESLKLEEDGVDAVIEASGAESSIVAGIRVLRPGGKYVQTGLGKKKIEFPIVEMSEKELLVRGCFRYGAGDFDLAISLIEKGLIEVKSLISSVSDFENVIQAWEKTASGEGVKNMVKGV